MALRLYAATTSEGKLRDFRAAAAAHAITIEPLPGLKTIPAPEEDGATFEANATLKAICYSRFAPGELVMADDSGLEVDALNGAPGVRSARFAADTGLVDSPDANDNTDVWNNMVLLQRPGAPGLDFEIWETTRP
jgi:XTP/dITP diphosphohydrolase